MLNFEILRILSLPPLLFSASVSAQSLSRLWKFPPKDLFLVWDQLWTRFWSRGFLGQQSLCLCWCKTHLTVLKFQQYPVHGRAMPWVFTKRPICSQLRVTVWVFFHTSAKWLHLPMTCTYINYLNWWSWNLQLFRNGSKTHSLLV